MSKPTSAHDQSNHRPTSVNHLRQHLDQYLGAHPYDKLEATASDGMSLCSGVYLTQEPRRCVLHSVKLSTYQVHTEESDHRPPKVRGAIGLLLSGSTLHRVLFVSVVLFLLPKALPILIPAFPISGLLPSIKPTTFVITPGLQIPRSCFLRTC